MRPVAAALALAAAACAGGHPMQEPGAPELAAAAQSLSSAVSTYEAGAASMADVAACVAAHGAYDAEVRPGVARMQELAGAMDAHMAEMGRPDHADMACAAHELMAELDRHAAAACASASDMAPNVAEVDAHAAAMAGWAGHERARAGEMDAMMDGGGMMGGGGMMDPGATLACPPAP